MTKHLSANPFTTLTRLSMHYDAVSYSQSSLSNLNVNVNGAATLQPHHVVYTADALKTFHLEEK